LLSVETALIVYHFCFNLSRTFLFFFLDSLSFAETALIVYHISFSLSRSFFYLFNSQLVAVASNFYILSFQKPLVKMFFIFFLILICTRKIVCSVYSILFILST